MIYIQLYIDHSHVYIVSLYFDTLWVFPWKYWKASTTRNYFLSVSVSVFLFPSPYPLGTYPPIKRICDVLRVHLFFFLILSLKTNLPLCHNMHIWGSYYNHKASNWRLHLKERNKQQKQMSIDFVYMQMLFIIRKGRELHKVHHIYCT